MSIRNYENECLSKCNFGDTRLTARALHIGDCLRLKYGQPLSKVFKNASELKRAYEFLANQRTSFKKVVEPSHYQTANYVRNLPIILSIGDTTFLDYKNIKLKREDYGPIGNGGNGLILHTSLAVDPDCGQPFGVLWEKVWKRTHTVKPKKKANRARPIEEKESYKWVEAIKKVPEILQEASVNNEQKVIHVFDREGDISEVFESVQKQSNCGLLVRATHNRSLCEQEDYLWNYLKKQPLQFEKEIELPKNHKRKKRTALLAVRFCQVKLRSPQRCPETDSFNIYAVYAEEINPPEGEEAILTPVQIKVLKAKSSSTKTAKEVLTIQWAIEAIARLGGYLEHRRKTPIGITVLWRGFLELMSLCEGWELRETF